MPASHPPERLRAFLAITVPAQVREQLREAQERLAAVTGHSTIRWTAIDQIHLTLKFLGNVPSAQLPALSVAVTEAAAAMSCFQLSARGLGCFPSPRRPSIIWAGLGGDLEQLRRLQERLDGQTRDFGSHTEPRQFHPHLTIGRVKSKGAEAHGLGSWLQAASSLEFGEWKVDNVWLIRSQLSRSGSIYTPVFHAPLQ